MNTNYRKTLIAAAVAALISTPAWSATDASEREPGAEVSRESQSQDAYSRKTDNRSVDGAARARTSANVLYSHTPDELQGMEVIGSDGETLGKIKTVVMDRSREDVHAVISSGGFLGMGTREILVPLAELKLVGDKKVEATFTKAAVAERPKYKAEQYGVMESNRRISDFSAFEPTMDPETQPSPRAAGDAPGSAMGAERSRAGEAAEMRSRMETRTGMGSSPLYGRTPQDMKGMEVIGSDGESIGKVKAIVASRDREQVHAVIASGGFLGLGAREILVPLDDVKVVDEKKLQVGFDQEAVKSHPEYQEQQYVELESDRPISEFSAFEPMKGKDDPAAKDRAPGRRY